VSSAVVGRRAVEEGTRGADRSLVLPTSGARRPPDARRLTRASATLFRDQTDRAAPPPYYSSSPQITHTRCTRARALAIERRPRPAHVRPRDLATKTTTPQPPSPDPWLAADKVQHFALSALGTLGVYWLLSRAAPDGAAAAAARLSRRRRLLIAAAALAGALGLLKELGDGPLWPGRASWRDGLADALGIAAAVVYAVRGGPLPGGGRGVAAAAAAAAAGGGGREDEDDGDEEEGLPLTVVELRPSAPGR